MFSPVDNNLTYRWVGYLQLMYMLAKCERSVSVRYKVHSVIYNMYSHIAHTCVGSSTYTASTCNAGCGIGTTYAA